MSVGSVGGLGAMGAMGISAAPALGVGGLNGPLGSGNAAALSALAGSRMDQLLELMDGFSSAEILIALMMAAASKNHKRQGGCDDSAMGFLLGMSLASQLGQAALQLPQSGGLPEATAVTGQQINLTA